MEKLDISVIVLTFLFLTSFLTVYIMWVIKNLVKQYEKKQKL